MEPPPGVNDVNVYHGGEYAVLPCLSIFNFGFNFGSVFSSDTQILNDPDISGPIRGQNPLDTKNSSSYTPPA
jgi:hypothetical protein